MRSLRLEIPCSIYLNSFKEITTATKKILKSLNEVKTKRFNRVKYLHHKRIDILILLVNRLRLKYSLTVQLVRVWFYICVNHNLDNWNSIFKRLRSNSAFVSTNGQNIVFRFRPNQKMFLKI